MASLFSARAAAVVILAGGAAAALVADDRPRIGPALRRAPSTPATADLPGQALGRCAAMDPQDPGDPRCDAAWTQNRRRFLGQSGRADRPTLTEGAAR